MKEKIIVWGKKIWLLFREVMNILTNVLVPLASLIVAILEILPVPIIWVKVAKMVEYWLFEFAGTASKIDKIIEEETKNIK